MSSINDLDTVLNEANTEIHTASARTREAVAALAEELSDFMADGPLAQAFAELKGAIDDLYDAGADLVVSVRKECVGFDIPTQRFAIEVAEDISEHDLASITEHIRPGDIVWQAGGHVVNVVGGTPPAPTTDEPNLDEEPPPTDFAVRVFFDNEVAEDIPNIIGIQVANLKDGTFPVGFIDPDGDGPVPGTFDEEGVFVPLEAKKRIGW